jgi:hypothetical protein
VALKKSELYSSLWSSCDELRGGMDASQYKDYVLVLLFIKYVSDKYAGKPYAPITIPVGAGFKDMVALKGTSDIGDQINKKIVGPLASANKLADMPDFNDVAKLGSGKEMVDRLTNLISIFENPALDFSKNRADGDDILGDAYESVLVGDGVEDVRALRRRRKRELDDFLERHLLRRDGLLLAAHDDDVLAGLGRAAVEMLVLAEMHRLVVVLDDGVFLIALHLPEKVVARLDVPQLVERLPSGRIGRLIRLLIDVNANFVLVVFHR